MVYRSCDPNDVYCESSLSTLGREGERERGVQKRKKLSKAKDRYIPLVVRLLCEISCVAPRIQKTNGG